MATKKITDLTQLTDLDATDSFVVNDSGAGADKRVEFSDLQSEVLNGAAIGTSTAVTELQVDNLNLNGNTFSSTDTNGNVIIQPNGTGVTIINEAGAGSDFRVEGLSDQNLLFVDASTDRVGIGTATPASLLDVDGDLTITDKIIHSGDTNTAIRFPSADTVTVETAGSERMRIDSSGNVGIGVTPSSKLHVEGAFGTTGNVLRLQNTTAAASGNAINTDYWFKSIAWTNARGAQLSVIGDGYWGKGSFIFSTHAETSATNVTEKVRIDSDGLKFNGDTAAANALDDYDTGTYTATLTPSTSGSITVSATDQLSFTKIGRLMTITGRIIVSSVSSPVGAVDLNLPTAIADLSDDAGRIAGGVIIYNTSINADDFFFAGVEGTSYIRILKGGSTAGTADSAQTFSGDEQLLVSFSYISA